MSGSDMEIEDVPKDPRVVDWKRRKEVLRRLLALDLPAGIRKHVKAQLELINGRERPGASDDAAPPTSPP